MTGRLANLHRAPSQRTLLRRVKGTGLHIVQVTDPHTWPLADGNPNASGAADGSRLYWGSGQKLGQVADQIATAAPDVLICTGDMSDQSADMSVWNARWAAMNAPVKLQVPGNHDFTSLPAHSGTSQQYVADQLGQTTPVVASSPFNQVVEVTGVSGVSATIITVDTNINASGLGASSLTGYLQEDAKTWLAGALAAATTDLILVASHHGPAMWTYHSYFDTTDAHDIRDIIDAEVATRPGRKIRWMFGHNHLRCQTQRWDGLTPNLPGILGPAVIEMAQAQYLHLYLWPNGDIYTEGSPVYCSVS